MGFVRDEAPLQERLPQRDRLQLLELLRRVVTLEVDQVVYDQVVFLGARVLKVGDRVDPCRERQLPGAFRDLTYCGQCLRLKNLARVGRQDDQSVVVLGIDLLQVFECSKLRIVFAKEILIVVFELDEAGAARGKEANAERADQDEPSPFECEVDIGSDTAAVRWGCRRFPGRIHACHSLLLDRSVMASTPGFQVAPSKKS